MALKGKCHFIEELTLFFLFLQDGSKNEFELCLGRMIVCLNYDLIIYGV